MPVCIAGMHRSGTSMIASYAHRCGLFLGPDALLMAAAAENPDGFWEHQQFVELNDEILNQVGGGWDCPPPPTTDWTTSWLDPLRTRATRLLREFAGHEPWGWKDPRTSLTLPFWRELVDGLRVVIVLRNPLEVALSLRRRNGFSLALGLTLWQVTYERLLASAPPGDRLLTHYDAYFGDPETELRRLFEFLDLSVDDEAIAELTTAAITSGLRHHRLTTLDLFDADVTTDVVDLYRVLCAEAGWADGDPPAPARTSPARPYRAAGAAGERPPDSMPGPPAATRNRLADGLALGIGRVGRANVEAAILRRELEEHQRSLAGRQARVEELEAVLVERDAKIVERDDRIAERDGKIAERDGRIAERDRQIAERDRQITGLMEALQLTIEQRDAVARELDALRSSIGSNQGSHSPVTEQLPPESDRRAIDRPQPLPVVGIQSA